jgi:hypothetical protein
LADIMLVFVGAARLARCLACGRLMLTLGAIIALRLARMPGVLTSIA